MYQKIRLKMYIGPTGYDNMVYIYQIVKQTNYIFWKNNKICNTKLKINNILTQIDEAHIPYSIFC